MTRLLDNEPADDYYYLITVYTALRGNAETKSKVGFVLAGDKGDTGMRGLYDGIREVGLYLNRTLALEIS